jgi:hypothetical protein
VEAHPNDPDTYLTIDAAGRVDFSVPESVVNAGVGGFDFQYQITDGQGNFATGTLRIQALLP